MQIRSIGEDEIPACSWGLPAGDRVSFFVALNVHPPASKKRTRETRTDLDAYRDTRALICVCVCMCVYARVIFSEALSLLS